MWPVHPRHTWASGLALILQVAAPGGGRRLLPGSWTVEGEGEGKGYGRASEALIGSQQPCSRSHDPAFARLRAP